MRLGNDDGSWEGIGLSVVLLVGSKVAKAALKGKKLKKNAAPVAWGWISPTSEIPEPPDLPAAD